MFIIVVKKPESLGVIPVEFEGFSVRESSLEDATRYGSEAMAQAACDILNGWSKTLKTGYVFIIMEHK